MQSAARKGSPGILLIYNNLDPFQLFGTEVHDFVSAMYGEMTVHITAKGIEDSFHGRNSMLRKEHNSSVSAVGHLTHSATGAPNVRLYENVFARNPLNFPMLPLCIEAVRIDIEHAQL